MKVQISDALLRSISAPGQGRIEVSDTVRPGLRLRISSSGRKVWVFEKRVKGGPKRKHTLGTYPEVSIKDARTLALDLEIEAIRGVDRIAIAEQEAKEQERKALSSASVQQVLETYRSAHLSNLRTGKAVYQSLISSLGPYLGDDVETLDRKTFQGMVDRKAASGAKVQANRLKAHLSRFGKFLWQRGYTENHHGLGLDKAIKEKSRERVLTIDEVRFIWEMSYKLTDLSGPLLRLIILTVQRTSEVAGLKWNEIDFDRSQMELLSARTKNATRHITHLSGAAMEQINARRGATESEFVFSKTGNTRYSGFSALRRQIDQHINDELAQRHQHDPSQKEEFEHWTFHDLRTAFATAMAERGEPESIIDRILNHAASGSAPSAVARVYNRSQHLAERKRILDAWAEVVTGSKPESTVVPFRSGVA